MFPWSTDVLENLIFAKLVRLVQSQERAAEPCRKPVEYLHTATVYLCKSRMIASDSFINLSCIVSALDIRQMPCSFICSVIVLKYST